MTLSVGLITAILPRNVVSSSFYVVVIVLTFFSSITFEASLCEGSKVTGNVEQMEDAGQGPGICLLP